MVRLAPARHRLLGETMSVHSLKLVVLSALFVSIAALALLGQSPASAALAPTATNTLTNASLSSSSAVTVTVVVTTSQAITPTATNTQAAATATKTQAAATSTKTSVPPTATKTKTLVPIKPVTVVITPTSALITPTKPIPSATPTFTKSPTATLAVPTKTLTPTVTPTKTLTPTVTRTATTAARAAVAGTVLPLSTQFIVQNMDASPVSINATFYNAAGGIAQTLTQSINPFRSMVFDQRDSSGGSGLPVPWNGSVVLSSTLPMAAVVAEYGGNAANSTDFRMDTYTGLSGARAGTSIVMTQLYKDIYDSIQLKRYNSTIAIQNTDLNNPATVTITYFGTALVNRGTYVHSGITIPPGASKVIDLSSATDEPYLPTAPADQIFLGAGILTSDSGTPVAVIVNHNAAGTLDSQVGLTSADAAKTLYFPQLYRDIYDQFQGYTFGSSIQIMKPNPTDPTTVNVTVTYKNLLNGGTSTQKGQLNSTKMNLNFDQRYGGVPSPFYGSATLDADAPVVATANIVTNFTNLGGRGLTYRAISPTTGSTRVYAPLLLKHYYDSGTGIYYGTAFQGRTTDGSAATIRVTYYYKEGGVDKQITLPDINVTAAKPQFTVEQRAPYDKVLPLGTIASAVVESTSPIAITVNVVGENGSPGDASGTYDGVNQ